jgi:hypothetical protein
MRLTNRMYIGLKKLSVFSRCCFFHCEYSTSTDINSIRNFRKDQMKHKKLKGPRPAPSSASSREDLARQTPVPPEVMLTRGDAYQR